MTRSGPLHPEIAEMLDARIQTLRPHRYVRAAVHRFLSYLHTDFPKLHRLSDLRRDPHLQGWLGSLNAQEPLLSDSTRRLYLIGLRRLLDDIASDGYALQPGLILSADLPAPPPRQPKPRLPRRPSPLPHPLFGKLFDDRIQALAITLQPSTLASYRNASRNFLSFVQSQFPELRQLSELRRHPHLLGWFRHLCQKDLPLNAGTRANYLFKLRRLLHDFAAQGDSVPPGLILPEDFPRSPQYLPRALGANDDQRLQQELRRTNDLPSTALLLTRATGIRIGECIHLAEDCLRSIGPDQWALHVPLGKLHTERLVPVEPEVRQMVTRILALRALAPSSRLAPSVGPLLPCPGSPNTVYDTLRKALNAAAQRARCPHVTCHQLRHTYASEMIRLGVSLPVLMQLLGHKDVRMTMRYIQITQRDLEREFHLARQNAVQHHHIPQISIPSSTASDLPGICRTLATTRHLLEMYRRQLQDEKASRKLQRLDKRLLSVAFELDRFGTAQK